MRAMVLAAGLGTRLRPLTNTRPKALVEVNGRTLLELTLTRLRSFGIREVIINVHHFADMMVDYLKDHQNFGMRIEISHEPELLDTGGGIKKAGWFFLEGGSDEPFIVHNVDVITNIDITRMLEFHHQHQALATVAVQKRETSRYLLFDDHLQLCGRRIGKETTELAPGSQPKYELAFACIHMISPRLLPMLKEEGSFSIIPAYLRLAAEDKKILAFRADESYWRDVGSPEHLAQAAQELRRNAASQ